MEDNLNINTNDDINIHTVNIYHNITHHIVIYCKMYIMYVYLVLMSTEVRAANSLK
jgi:hypothetical protein